MLPALDSTDRAQHLITAGYDLRRTLFLAGTAYVPRGRNVLRWHEKDPDRNLTYATAIF